MKGFDDVADFMIIYMEEAHPIEGWRIRVRFFDSLSLYRNGVKNKGFVQSECWYFSFFSANCGNLPGAEPFLS